MPLQALSTLFLFYGSLFKSRRGRHSTELFCKAFLFLRARGCTSRCIMALMCGVLRHTEPVGERNNGWETSAQSGLALQVPRPATTYTSLAIRVVTRTHHRSSSLRIVGKREHDRFTSSKRRKINSNIGFTVEVVSRFGGKGSREGHIFGCLIGLRCSVAGDRTHLDPKRLCPSVHPGNSGVNLG